jgi:hypothetical protein
MRGRKVTHFRYSPKKRIRVRGGHRTQYTRLMVDFIGRTGEVRKTPIIERPVPAEKPVSTMTTEKQAVSKPAVKKSSVKRPVAGTKTPAKSPGIKTKK